MRSQDSSKGQGRDRASARSTIDGAFPLRVLLSPTASFLDVMALIHPACLLVLLLPLFGHATAPSERPNVLFIAVDDLRTSLGCYGDRWVQSPHIDRFSLSACRFDHAYAQQAVCGPSRTSLLSGRLPDHTQVWHNRNRFRATHPDLVTLPQHFKNHGYHTLSLGKVFSGDERELDPASWSEPEILKQKGWKNSALGDSSGEGKGAAWEAADVPDEGYADGRLAQLAVQHLTRLHQAQQPFFLAVGFFKPHLPFNAPKKYWDLYDPAIFDGKDDGQPVVGVSEHAHHSHRELGGYRGIPKDEQLDAATARTLRHGYHACVSYVDAQIGRLLAALDDLGLAHNTLVVLWGDHGFALGEKNRWCKGTNFERDTRVPLLMRAPGIGAPGGVATGLVELVDVYPTLVELAQLPMPSGLDGRSLVPLLRHPATPGRDAVLSQFARPFSAKAPEFMGYSLRTASHRYTRWVTWPARQIVAEELYDYSAGLSTSRDGAFWIEHQNLASDAKHGPKRDALSRQLDAMLTARLGQ